MNSNGRNGGQKQGCLMGLMELFALNKASEWAQQKFGFGNGCMGCGCGFVILIIAFIIFMRIVFGTDWTSFFQLPSQSSIQLLFKSINLVPFI